MENKESEKGKEQFPTVCVQCDHCQTEFIGILGPVQTEKSFFFHQCSAAVSKQVDTNDPIWWKLPAEKHNLQHILLTHHMTVRDGAQGHHQFSVFLDTVKIGIVRVGTNAQVYSQINT